MLQTYPWRLDERIDHDYLLFLPDGYADSDRDWPMLVYLHGGGGTAEGTTRALEPLRGEPYVILAPICPPPAPGTDPMRTDWDMRILPVIIDQVCRDQRIDESRVALMGFSMGGSGAWALPYFAPERFDRVVVISGSCHPWKVKYYPKIPVWVFSGGDEEWLPQHTNTVSDAHSFGLEVTHTIWPGLGHGACHRQTIRHPPLQAWLRRELPAPMQPD